MADIVLKECLDGVKAVLDGLPEHVREGVAEEILYIQDMVTAGKSVDVRKDIARILQRSKNKYVTKQNNKSIRTKNTTVREGIAEENQVEAIRNFLETKSVRGGDTTVEPMFPVIGSQLEAAEGAARGQMLAVFEKSKLRTPKGTMPAVRAMMEFPHLDKALREEMMGLQTPYGETGIREIAGEMHEILRKNAEDLQAEGITFKLTKDYFPQLTDAGRVMGDIDGYKKFLKKHLDEGMYEEGSIDAQIDGFVKKIQDGTSDLGNRHLGGIQEQRAILLRDATARSAYFELFGPPTTSLDAILSKNVSLRKELVLARDLGASPWEELRFQLEEANTTGKAKLFADESLAKTLPKKEQRKALKRINTQRSRILADSRRAERMINHLSGRRGEVGSARLARNGQITREWIMMSSLGRIMTYAMTDTMSSQLDLSKVKSSSAIRGMGTMLRRATDLKGESEIAQLGKQLGISDDLRNGGYAQKVMGVDALAQTDSTGASRLSAKSVDTFFKVSGVNHTTSMIRDNHAFQMLQSISAHKGRSFSDLADVDSVLHTRLKEQGVTDDIFQRIVREENFSKKNKMINVDNMEDSQARDILTGFLHREASFAVSFPDLYMRSTIGQTATAGTWKGEALMLAWQFQSFGMAYMRKAASRATRERSIPSLAYFAGAMVLMSVMRTQVDQLAAGNPAYEFDSPTLWADAIDKSGIFWYAGALGSSVTRNVGSGRGAQESVVDVLGGAFGPTASHAVNSLKIVAQAGEELWEDEGLSASTYIKSVRETASLIPFHNVILWSWIVTQGVNSVINDIDPYSRYKMMDRYQNQGRNLDVQLPNVVEAIREEM